VAAAPRRVRPLEELALVIGHVGGLPPEQNVHFLVPQSS
jgi:hypothetical protein